MTAPYLTCTNDTPGACAECVTAAGPNGNPECGGVWQGRKLLVNGPLILRRGNLDERDRAILQEVWLNWSHHLPTSYRWLRERTGASLGGLKYRITGEGHNAKALIAEGWLRNRETPTRGVRTWRTLRPGPRFAGMDAGWPLELVQ